MLKKSTDTKAVNVQYCHILLPSITYYTR